MLLLRFINYRGQAPAQAISFAIRDYSSKLTFCRYIYRVKDCWDQTNAIHEHIVLLRQGSAMEIKKQICKRSRHFELLATGMYIKVCMVKLQVF